FGNVLWELKLDAIEAKVNSLKNSNQAHPNFIEAHSENEDFYIKFYDTLYLESGEILRTSASFQDKEWFSNVAVFAAEDQKQYESDK
ncbi:9979_t:CDS:2, partial [Racocetra fulgida]